MKRLRAGGVPIDGDARVSRAWLERILGAKGGLLDEARRLESELAKAYDDPRDRLAPGSRTTDLQRDVVYLPVAAQVELERSI